MRILLDENIPVQPKSFFRGHEIRSVNDRLPTNRRREVLALGEQIAALVESMSVGDYVILEKTGVVVKRSFDRPG